MIDFAFQYWDIKTYDGDDIPAKERQYFKLFQKGYLGLCLDSVSSYEYDAIKNFLEDKPAIIEEHQELIDTFSSRYFSNWCTSIWFKDRAIYDETKIFMDSLPKRTLTFTGLDEIILPELSPDFNFMIVDMWQNNLVGPKELMLSCSDNEVDVVAIKLLNDNLR